MDQELALPVVSGLGTLTLLGGILLVVLVILLILSRISKKKNPLVSFFGDNALAFSLIIASIATAGSLFFSEIAHFVPCKLCWFQRIFMYPQVVLLGIAVFKNDWGIKKYVLPLSLIGAAIALYHYLLQMYPAYFPCSDEVANCAFKQFTYYGYITIPMMALTAFLLIAFLILLGSGEKRGK